MITRVVASSRVGPRRGSPFIVINVKPYFLIMYGRQIYCDKALGLPMVFDTVDLAELCAECYGLENYRIKSMELEELARKCRDPRVRFTQFILITDSSQLIWNGPVAKG